MDFRYVGVSEFDVLVHEVGPDKKARLKSLFNYLQANIHAHSRKLGSSLSDIEVHNLSWVYARFYTEIKQYPVLNQKIICRTWLPKLDQYLAHRDFTISDENNNIILAATVSIALINRDTRKPVEIKVPEGKTVEIYTERSVDHSFGRMHDLESYSITYRTSARYEDIDVNNHMNNASYAQMFYESIAGHLQGTELASIDISFKGEVSVHDELVCLSEPGENVMYHHKMLNETKNNISALAVTTWR
jgi:acyl-ACP thioesterase